MVSATELENNSFFLSYFSYLIFYTSMMMILSLAYYQLQALNMFVVKSKSENIPVEKIIKQTSIIYDKLCDIFELISAFYRLHNLNFLLGFYYNDFSFYYVLFILIKNPGKEIFYFFLTNVLWNLCYLPGVLWTMLFSSWIETEGIKTANLINQLASQESTMKCLKSSRIINLKMTHRRPKVSCGMFDLNWKFFFTMIGSIFSSAIILIQFYDVSKT